MQGIKYSQADTKKGKLEIAEIYRDVYEEDLGPFSRAYAFTGYIQAQNQIRKNQ